MILIPAIDLLDGRCVRLRQGDFEKCHVYDRPPRTLAGEYAQTGAQWLHVVDLAASRDGPQADTKPLFRLLSSTSQRIQTGGGVREVGDVEARLEAGAARAVVGSIAAHDPALFVSWLEHFSPEAVVAALDVRIDEADTPRVRSHGWTRDSGNDLWALLDHYSSRLRHVLITDIGRDGEMAGPNLALYQAVCARYPVLQVQASGGVRDVRDLRALAKTGVAAAVCGKALLDGRFTVEEALSAVRTEH